MEREVEREREVEGEGEDDVRSGGAAVAHLANFRSHRSPALPPPSPARLPLLATLPFRRLAESAAMDADDSDAEGEYERRRLENIRKNKEM